MAGAFTTSPPIFLFPFLLFFTLILLVQSKQDHHEAQFLPRKELGIIHTKQSFYQNPAAPPRASKRYKFIENPPGRSKSRKKTISGWILGILAGTFAGGIFGIISSVLYKFRSLIVKGHGKKAQGLTIFSTTFIKNPEDLAFLENDGNLLSLDMIGSGGCGQVYKAELPEKMIAIKKITYREAEEADNKKKRQIRSEIQTVGQIRHRNLLPLLAHVAKPECDILVFEYMKNGSLLEALRRELDWLTRHRIAVGIAAGLEHLHMNNSQCVLHRDLKPENVLVDDDMEARITDFGLALSLPHTHTHVTASCPDGTVGYIAPEYSQTLRFTDKCDIYSFGMILSVLVTGKLPTDEFYRQTEELFPVIWLRNMMNSEDPKRAIDPRLLGNGYEEQMVLVLKIAVFCTVDNPRERPNSKKVRCMLSEIKH